MSAVGIKNWQGQVDLLGLSVTGWELKTSELTSNVTDKVAWNQDGNICTRRKFPENQTLTLSYEAVAPSVTMAGLPSLGSVFTTTDANLNLSFEFLDTFSMRVTDMSLNTGMGSAATLDVVLQSTRSDPVDGCAFPTGSFPADSFCNFKPLIMAGISQDIQATITEANYNLGYEESYEAEVETGTIALGGRGVRITGDFTVVFCDSAESPNVPEKRAITGSSGWIIEYPGSVSGSLREFLKYSFNGVLDMAMPNPNAGAPNFPGE